MFVLQECSICFEDFDNERNPHSIPCGHVFCRPCLGSLMFTPNCPNCRTSFTVQSIRRVVCTQQEPGSALAESEEETLMWQAIKDATVTPSEYEQRKSLAEHNSLEGVRQTGMSTNLLIALDVLRMLVEAEQQVHELKDKVDTAQAVEESLYEHISTLEEQLGGETSETGLRGMQLLLAQVRLIKSDTSTIVRHLNIDPSAPIKSHFPIQPRTKPQPPTPVIPDPSPGGALPGSAPKSWSSLLRAPSSQNPSNNSGSSTPHVRAGPSSDAGRPLHVRRLGQSPQQEYLSSHGGAPSISSSGDIEIERVGTREGAPSVGVRGAGEVGWRVAGGGALSGWGYEDMNEWPDLGASGAAFNSSGSQASVARLASPAAAGPVADADGFTSVPGRRGQGTRGSFDGERGYRGRGRGRGGFRGSDGGGYRGDGGEEAEGSEGGYRGRGGSRNRQAYLERLSEDPSFIPRVGAFWGHDERLVAPELRDMSEWLRGRRDGRGRGFRGRAQG